MWLFKNEPLWLWYLFCFILRQTWGSVWPEISAGAFHQVKYAKFWCTFDLWNIANISSHQTCTFVQSQPSNVSMLTCLNENMANLASTNCQHPASYHYLVFSSNVRWCDCKDNLSSDCNLNVFSYQASSMQIPIVCLQHNWQVQLCQPLFCHVILFI